MKRNTQLCIDLKSFLQHDSLPQLGKGYAGVLTQMKDDLVYFVEQTPERPRKHNPCIYNGKHLTLTVRKADGQPRLNFKALRLDKNFNEQAFVLGVLNDLIQAFECLVEK